MRFRSGLAFLVSSAAILLASSALAPRAAAQVCTASCFEKSYVLALDQNGNGGVDPGDIVRFDVTFCNGADPGSGPPLDCLISDSLNGLNTPLDLQLADDPSNPGTKISCTANDPGPTSCAAAPGGTTIVACDALIGSQSISVSTMMVKDACITIHFWALANPIAMQPHVDCNQATGGGGRSNNPATPAANDPTCFLVPSGRAIPILQKSIVGCPAPCAIPVRSAPGLTTVVYEVLMGPNPVNMTMNFDFLDDIPAGAVGFRVLDKGYGYDCVTPDPPIFCGLTQVNPPVCNNIPAPGGANGTGKIVINGYNLCGVGGGPNSARIRFAVDFACPPVTDPSVVSNQAGVFIPLDPGACNPSCPSDDPVTPAVNDATTFSATCLAPPAVRVEKTRTDPNPNVWLPGDPVTVNYSIRITNTGGVPLSDPDLTVTDYLPVDPIFHSPRFDPSTCPIAVIAIPPQPNMSLDDTNCSAATDPSFTITKLEPLAPGNSVDLLFSVVFPADMGGLPDSTVVRNMANVGGLAGADDPADFTIIRPQPVDFRSSTKTASSNPLPAGSLFSYTVTVTNTGVGTATNVVVNDTFPACISTADFDPVRDVSAVPGPIPPPTFTSGTLSVSLGSMAPSDVQTITIAGLRAGSDDPACCNQAFMSADQIPPPGQRTDDPATAAPSDSTCVEIKTISSGCDLYKSLLTFPPLSPARVAPWVYTNTTGCTAPDQRVGTTLLLTPAADDQDVDPIAPTGSGGELTFYQFTCPCVNGIKMVKNRTTGKVHELFCSTPGCL